MTSRSTSAARLVRIAIACCSAIALVAPFATYASAAACDVVGRVVERRGWTSIRVPAFSEGGDAITDLVVNGAAPEQMFVTNGMVVQRTNDGGCHWSEVYKLRAAPSLEQPFSASSATIVSLAVAGTGHRPNVVLRIAEEVAGVDRPHVVRSGDGGATWETGDAGLPAVGRAQFLRGAPSDRNVFYLGIDVGQGAIDLVYASTDGGRTWDQRSDLGKVEPNIEIADLVVDPLRSNELWAWGAAHVHHSTDGGRSFERVDEFEKLGATGPGDVFHQYRLPSRVLVYAPQLASFFRSDDGGKTWAENAAPAGVDSVATARSADETLVTARGRVYAYHPGTYLWLDLDAPAAGVTDLSAWPSRYAFYGRTESTVEIYTGPRRGGDPPSPPPDELVKVSRLLDEDDRDEQRLASITPRSSKVVIDPGRSKKVHYRVEMPKTPVPLDVFFLVDTSGSMTNEINGMRLATGDIINELIRARIDVELGIGEYRAYPDVFPPRPRCESVQIPSQTCETNFAYRRVLDVQEYDSTRTEQALGGLEADGGGHWDSMLEALYQSATGAGADLFPPGPSDHDVPPGHNPTFREKAVKVVLHIADEKFKTKDDDPPSQDLQSNRQRPDIPTFDEVIGALREHERGIYQVGLAVRPDARPGLEKVARGTEALAPAGGVDCDGDGDRELDEGQALVCPIRPQQFADADGFVGAVVSLLRAVSPKASVALDVTGARQVVGTVAPEFYEGVVLQAAHELDFTVEYRCPLKLAGERRRLQVEALTAGRIVAAATAEVVCRDVSKAAKQPPISALEALLGAVPPLAAPPPPLTVTSSATQSQTQAQSQAQAQGAAAMQEEEQPQMAFVDAFDATEEQLGEEYAMSSYERRNAFPVAPEAVLGFGAAVLLLAYGCFSLLTERVRVERIRR